MTTHDQHPGLRQRLLANPDLALVIGLDGRGTGQLGVDATLLAIAATTHLAQDIAHLTLRRRPVERDQAVLWSTVVDRIHNWDHQLDPDAVGPSGVEWMGIEAWSALSKRLGRSSADLESDIDQEAHAWSTEWDSGGTPVRVQTVRDCTDYYWALAFDARQGFAWGIESCRTDPGQTWWELFGTVGPAGVQR